MPFVSSTGTIIEEIISRLRGIDIQDEHFYTKEINLCLRDIQNSFPKAPFLQTSADRTLSSGTRLYTNLPSDFTKMNDIVYPAGDIKLTYLTPEEFDILQPSATEGGNPTLYTIRGQGSNARIEFYPVPGSNLTVHYNYLKEITTVSAFSSVPDIPERYYELCVLFGESRGFRRNKLYQESRMIMQEYEALKQKMIDDLLKQTTENTRIKSIREFQTAGRAFNDPIVNIFNTRPV